ncbi:MAG: tetratricopeptide repeat protein [Bacteroidota bacterium]
MNRFLLLFLAMACLAVACADQKEQPASSESTLGELQYILPVSDKARPEFDTGLLLLHSFEYDDAREAFEAAIQADSSEIMGYWGVAMSHYKALWGLQNIPAGRKTMARIADTKEQRIATATEGIERDLWKGIEILYGSGELKERNEAYTEHMAGLHEKYANSQEVAAFYALSLMWSASIDADDEVYKMSANVAKGILKENPNHPGAVHYIIHAYDNPELAHLAIDAANKYAEIAPDAAHALHMPSHIYLGRGMWNEVVSSNETSYQASVKRMERKGLTDKARGFHSYQWLHYGYLQQGRYQKAAELLSDMLKYTAITQTSSARSYLLKMQNMQVTETGKWPLTVAPMTVKTDDIGIEKQAQQHFFISLMDVKNRDGSKMQLQIDSLDEKISTAELLITSAGIAMCSAGPTRYAPNKMSILNAKTMLSQMKAMHALTTGDEAGAEGFFKQAVAYESQAEYAYGPPDVVYPSFEHYGYWLLEKGRYNEAIKQFDISLKRAPLRAMALRGKIRALEALGKVTEAANIQAKLDEFWQQSAMNS